ncbi:MAG: hypothetical protein JXA90_07675 [Planctomycetes bacterium]|nr:hypothetical protein [Planctomycetota bacterium]
MNSGQAPGPSGAQKAYYLTILLPMWRGQLDRLGAAEREYRHHLLAVECLRIAKGPGADPVRISDFCRTWKIPLTLPVIGPTALLRKIGKAAGGWPSQAAVFDPTGAINIGIKVIAHMGPLLGRIQMSSAALIAMDSKVIELGDQTSVGSILELSRTPEALMTRLKESRTKLERLWKETVDLAAKMEPMRVELGLPETVS